MWRLCVDGCMISKFLCVCVCTQYNSISSQNKHHHNNTNITTSHIHPPHPFYHHPPGLDVETGTPTDLGSQQIFDLYSSKWWALRLAADAAVTVLRVDQIIMSKQAGGPKPRAGGNADDD